MFVIVFKTRINDSFRKTQGKVKTNIIYKIKIKIFNGDMKILQRGPYKKINFNSFGMEPNLFKLIKSINI